MEVRRKTESKREKLEIGGSENGKTGPEWRKEGS